MRLQHSIPFYQSDPERFSNGPTLLAFSNLMAMCLLVFGSFTIPFLTLWWFLAMGASTLHMALYLTNERFLMSKGEVTAWKDYRSLPRDHQKKIGLTPGYVKSLPAGSEWEQLKSKLRVAKDAHHARQRAEGLEPDRFMRYTTSIDAVIAVERERTAFAEERNEAILDETTN